MPLLEAIRLALRTIRAQKLKSFFSLVGVLIGVTFLIAVVSIVQGMNRYMVERFANTLIGANTFELRHRWSPAAVAALACLFGLCLLSLYGSSPTPYLYFQF